MPDWRDCERLARRAIEDVGFVVHDANILFQQNCPNIDLVVYGPASACYFQVKASVLPATKGSVTVCGAPWTEEQLLGRLPVYNRHKEEMQASHVVVVDFQKDGSVDYFIVPPKDLERIAKRVGRKFWKKPKLDGTQRKPFRKEVPRALLLQWKNNWELLCQRTAGVDLARPARASLI
jgi:hypothetical protein